MEAVGKQLAQQFAGLEAWADELAAQAASDAEIEQADLLGGAS